MKKDYMTVKGIKKDREGSMYWDLPGDDTGIFYYPDKTSGFLIRQVLPQDLELVKRLRSEEAKKFIVVKNEVGARRLIPLNKLFPEKDEDVMEMIKKANPINNDDGSMSLLVFNIRSKELIASVDVMPIHGTDEEAALGFAFSRNKLIQKRFGKKLKNFVKELLISEKIYKVVKEEIWSTKVQGYELIPM